MLFNYPGSPLASGLGKRVLVGPLPAGSTPPVGVFTGLYPSAISGLSGWWDAGLLGGLRDVTGAPLTASNTVVGVVVDKSGNGSSLTSYHISADTAPVATIAVPRVNGYLGAVGAPDAGAANNAPALDADWGLLHSGFELGAGVAWTRYLVWTRPNWRQGTYYVNSDPIPLIHTNYGAGTTVLQADSSEGSNLTLFPGTASQTVLSAMFARRHSHAIILRNTPGEGVDAWLDGVQVASGIANPLAASANAQVIFLHDGSVQGSAQCWFHEAATWERALSVMAPAAVRPAARVLAGAGFWQADAVAWTRRVSALPELLAAPPSRREASFAMVLSVWQRSPTRRVPPRSSCACGVAESAIPGIGEGRFIMAAMITIKPVATMHLASRGGSWPLLPAVV